MQPLFAISVQRDYMEAELAVGFQFFAERYLSKVYLEPEKRIEVSAHVFISAGPLQRAPACYAV